MPPKGNSMTVPAKGKGKLKRKLCEDEPGQAAGASVSCSSFWVCSQLLTLVDWMTESDKTDGIHDCIQLWSNSNAHHDYFERLQLVFVVECSSVRLNLGQLYRKRSGLLLSSRNWMAAILFTCDATVVLLKAIFVLQWERAHRLTCWFNGHKKPCVWCYCLVKVCIMFLLHTYTYTRG